MKMKDSVLDFPLKLGVCILIALITFFLIVTESVYIGIEHIFDGNKHKRG